MSSYYQGTSLQCFTDATAQIPDLWSLLSKSKTERTHKEVEPAINFLKGLSVFTSMQSDKIDLTELLLEFLEVMQCEAFQKGETIFNYKDKPSKFYIILRGSVDIYVPKTSEERKTDNLKLEKLIQKKRHSLQRCSITEEKNCEFGKSTPIEETNLQKTKQFEQILSNKRSNSSKTKIEALNSILSSEDYFLINYEELASKLKKAKNLGPGSYFGEIALIMDCLRSAKVVASSDLHVATLSKDDYERILHQISCDFKEKVNFFIKLTGLNSNEAIRVARFCYGFKEKKYTFGQKIFKQGEISQEVFIVKQGEVQISTQEILDKEYHLELVSPCLQKKKRFLTRKLAILNAYNFLGESEALTMKPYDTTAASSSNETILYIIPAHEFRRLQAEYKDIFKKLSIKYETKASYFKGRIESLNAFENPATDRPPSRMRSHNGTPRILSNQDIQNIHGSKLIQEKAKKLALPKVQDIPLKRPPKSLRNYYSSKAQDEDLLSPVSLFSNATSRYDPAAKNVSKLFPKGKTESTCPSNEQTPKNTSKDRSTFGDYFSTSIGDVVHKEQKSQEFPDSINSRLSRFISKLKNRKLKESTRPSAAILIKSCKFEEDRYKSLKVQTKESTVLDKDSLASSSSEGDSSIFDNTQIFTKNKKSRCSIIHHIK